MFKIKVLRDPLSKIFKSIDGSSTPLLFLPSASSAFEGQSPAGSHSTKNSIIQPIGLSAAKATNTMSKLFQMNAVKDRSKPDTPPKRDQTAALPILQMNSIDLD